MNNLSNAVRRVPPAEANKLTWHASAMLFLLAATLSAPLSAEQPPATARSKSVLLRPVAQASSRRTYQALSQPEEEFLQVIQEAAQPELLPPAEVPATPSLRQTMPEELEGIDIGIEPIGSINLTARRSTEASQLPPDRAAEVFSSEAIDSSAALAPLPRPRLMPLSGEFAYRPLYFEEANFERYGNRRGCIQPVWSAARFYATIPALPYLTANEPPHVSRYKSYPYQAGRSAPRVKELPPLTVRGGVSQATVVMGLIFLIP